MWYFKAAFHYQHGGPARDLMESPTVLLPDGALYKQLQAARDSANWLEVHRLLLLLNLINMVIQYNV